jgi:hypothetical protein
VLRRRLDQIKMMERAGKEELDRHQRLRIEEVTHLEAEVRRRVAAPPPPPPRLWPPFC